MNIFGTNKTSPETEIHRLPNEDGEVFYAVTVNGEWITSEPDTGQYPEGQRWLLRKESSSWRVLCLDEDQAIELRDEFLKDIS